MKKITMSNTLARASQGLLLSEKRIISLALTRFNPRKHGLRELALVAGFTIVIPATLYADFFKVSRDIAYVHLKAAANNLLRREVCYNEMVSDEIQMKKIAWASSARYIRESGAWLEINFSKEIAAHLLELEGEFISYDLSGASDLKSIYAWRLLECLESWRIKKEWTVKIEDFYLAMNAKAGYRRDFSSLRTRIIDPAVSALKKKEWSLGCAQIREGHKLIALRFDFEKPVQPQPPKPPVASKPAKADKKTRGFNFEQERLDQMRDREEEADYKRKNPQESFDDDDYS